MSKLGDFLMTGGMSLLMPKPPKTDELMPEDVTAPTAEEGSEIWVLFGTRDIQRSNTVWYGDVSTRPHKVKGGKK